jgi:MFS family permease
VLGSRLLNAAREPWGLVAGVVLVALGLGFVSLAPLLIVACALTLVAGVGEGYSGVAENGILQRRTPDAIRSRVFAVSEAAVFSAFAISFLFAGPLVELVGSRGAYAIAGVSCLIAAGVLATVFGELRKPGPELAVRHSESTVKAPKGP